MASKNNLKPKTKKLQATHMRILTGTLVLLHSLLFATAQTIYSASDSITTEQLLSKAISLPPKTCLTVFFGNKLAGLPYKSGTLEKNYVGRGGCGQEQLIVNTREFDCTTFVETVLALARTAERGKHSFYDFCNNLQAFRYQQGTIADYTSRNHYFSTWIDNATSNSIMYEVVPTDKALCRKRKLNIHYMTSHPERYHALQGERNEDYLRKIKQMEQRQNMKEVTYIPKNVLNNPRNLLSFIKDGDIVAIETSKEGLDTSHVGIAVWSSDNRLRFIHASSAYHKVVTSPVYTYLKKQKHAIGIRILRLK